jgi:replicative DNA helicase
MAAAGDGDHEGTGGGEIVRTNDQLPPHSIEAEQGVIACCLMDGANAVSTCVEQFKGAGAVFYDLRHQKLFEVMVGMVEANQPIDMITLPQRLTEAGELEGIGGMTYLQSLPEMVPSAANLPYYLEILWEKALARRMVRTCTQAVSRLYHPEVELTSLSQVMDQTEKELLELSSDRTGSAEVGIKEVMLKTSEDIDEYHRGHGQMRGIPTGFEYLDKMICGLGPGQLIVLAARPGVGKTSLAMNIAEYAAVDKGIPVAVFSIEMSTQELGSRLVFQRAQSDYQRYRTGFLLNEDLIKLTVAIPQIAKAPMWIDDSAEATVMEIRAKARRFQRQYGIKLLIIDYLQLIRGINRYNNREAEVADISRGLKGLAKELKIPVLVLAQLNRDLEKERSRMPRLSDLRESGAVEQDADVVMMLYEPRLTEEQEEAIGRDWSQNERPINLLVAKQRNGPTGNVELMFRKYCMKFLDRHRPGKPAVPEPVAESELKKTDWPDPPEQDLPLD